MKLLSEGFGGVKPCNHQYRGCHLKNPTDINADIAVRRRTLTETSARPKDKHARNVARRIISNRYAGVIQHEQKVHMLDPELVASKLSSARESLPRL